MKIFQKSENALWTLVFGFISTILKLIGFWRKKHRKRFALGCIFFTQVWKLGVADLPTLSRILWSNYAGFWNGWIESVMVLEDYWFFLEYLLSLQNLEALVHLTTSIEWGLRFSFFFLLRREEVKVINILSSLFTKKLDIFFYICIEINNESVWLHSKYN